MVLPDHATLTEIPGSLLAPGALPGLWDGPEVTVKGLHDYFSGSRTVQVSRNGYEEPLIVPRAEKAAVEEAVREGTLSLASGPASLLAEGVPPGVLSDVTVLQAPRRSHSQAPYLDGLGAGL